MSLTLPTQLCKSLGKFKIDQIINTLKITSQSENKETEVPGMSTALNPYYSERSCDITENILLLTLWMA